MPSTIRFARLFTRLYLVGYLLMASCSSPSATNRTTPPDPAADSVADGLVPTSDTTIVDDDTLETGTQTHHR